MVHQVMTISKNASKLAIAEKVDDTVKCNAG